MGAGLAGAGVLGPTSAALVGLSTFGTLAGGIQAYQTGQRNQDALNQAAKDRERANTLNEARHRDQTERLMALQRATIGASGITASGSPMSVLMDTAHQYEIDKSIRLFNSSVDATRQRNQGEMEDYQGRMNLFNSFINSGVNAYGMTSLFER